MKYIGAQFSIKFIPQKQIRRLANDIEDLLSEKYMAPQVLPVPDDFSPAAPRIVFMSEHGHSQIIVSQLSIDLAVTFDNDFIEDFSKTKEYLIERLDIVKKILNKIGIERYCYCGLAYSARVELNDNETPLAFISRNMSKLGVLGNMKLHDAGWRKTYIDDSRYFVNEQVEISRRMDGVKGIPPELMEFTHNKMVSEDVVVTIDANSRRNYQQTASETGLSDIDNDVSKIFELVENGFSEWNNVRTV